MLCATPLAATLHDLDRHTIVAVSPAGAELLAGEPEDIVGRSVEDFLDGPTSGALALLAQGRVGAYETRRRLRHTGAPVRIWVRALPASGVRAAVAVWIPEKSRPKPAAPLPSGNVVAIGSVDGQLRIEHVTSDITGMIGFRAEELAGTSLLRLVDPADAGRLLELTTSVSDANTHGSRTLRVRLRHGGRARCEVLLIPHTPCGYAFAIIATGDAPDTAERALQHSLHMLPVEVRSAGVAHDAAHLRSRDVLSKLASRELEVVTELLNGDRVPAIARKLYLSQGTVRNHLSAAYRKLGVGNQQELIDLLRQPASATRSRPP
jgi:DNA-binding CsgD family transcriptional regulator